MRDLIVIEFKNIFKVLLSDQPHYQKNPQKDF